MIESAYIHIPFCIRKCNYCSFISGESLKYKEQYISALLREIKTRYKNEKLKTLYFGGGTPSLLEENDLEKIISCFSFQNDAEITIEVNPETVEAGKFKEIKNLGFNRISLGVQTFNDEILDLIGRHHTNKMIYEAIDTIKDIGFKNISIDLIYGLPRQTPDSFKEDVEKAIKLETEHISSYGLKIEENSYFYNNMPMFLPDDETQAQMYLYLCKELEKHGFNQYEISNFAKKNYESQHNCAYWKNKNYYGFGQNASGYEKNIRYKNRSDFSKYILNPLIKEENITLSCNEILEEEIFLALRLTQGINIEEINKKFDIDFEKKYAQILSKYEKLGLLEIKNSHCKLTQNGFLLSNEIMSEFIN